MTRRLLKFVIHPPTEEIETEDVPTFRSIGWQGEDLVVWCEATPGRGVKSRLAAVMTGEAAPLPEDHAEYVGTAQTTAFGSPLVVHVYAALPVEETGRS